MESIGLAVDGQVVASLVFSSEDWFVKRVELLRFKLVWSRALGGVRLVVLLFHVFYDLVVRDQGAGLFVV